MNLRVNSAQEKLAGTAKCTYTVVRRIDENTLVLYIPSKAKGNLS